MAVSPRLPVYLNRVCVVWKKKGKRNHVSSIWDALRSHAEQPRPRRTKAGVKIVETLTFTRANRGQVKALEKDIFPSDLCVCVCVITNASVHGWVRLSGGICPCYCSWPSERCCLCTRLTDGEWVWVTALWQSDESRSLLYSLAGSTLEMYVHFPGHNNSDMMMYWNAKNGTPTLSFQCYLLSSVSKLWTKHVQIHVLLYKSYTLNTFYLLNFSSFRLSGLL